MGSWGTHTNLWGQVLGDVLSQLAQQSLQRANGEDSLPQSLLVLSLHPLLPLPRVPVISSLTTGGQQSSLPPTKLLQAGPADLDPESSAGAKRVSRNLFSSPEFCFQDSFLFVVCLKGQCPPSPLPTLEGRGEWRSKGKSKCVLSTLIIPVPARVPVRAH